VRPAELNATPGGRRVVFATLGSQLLQQAEAAGYFKMAGTTERLAVDKDFDAVCDRPEFQQFVEKLSKK
jgi:hypothetical protein